MIKAYAKINLGLRITGKRQDGFHNIETIFHLVDLFDEIDFLQSDSINVECNHPHVPSGPANLAHRAASALQNHLGINKGVNIRIQKRIPPGAGLGGGSSDAATVLRALPQFWKKEAPPEDLSRIALQLGSDVPYFLRQGTALGRGRGELLEYFALDLPFAVLLCNPGIHISTAWAYDHVTPSVSSGNLRSLLENSISHPTGLQEALHNDFEDLVFQHHEVVGTIKSTMIHEGAVAAAMSGSGSTVYGLFDDVEKAKRLAGRFTTSGYHVSLTEPHFAPNAT